MNNLSADEVLTRLRAASPPIIARVADGRTMLDLRTVFPKQDGAIVAKLQALAETPA